MRPVHKYNNVYGLYIGHQKTQTATLRENSVFFPWHRVYSPNVLRNRAFIWIIQTLDGVQLTQESIMLMAASGPFSN